MHWNAKAHTTSRSGKGNAQDVIESDWDCHPGGVERTPWGMQSIHGQLQGGALIHL